MMSDDIRNKSGLHEKIKQILIRDWDPIGVQDIPKAQDEYDAAYAPDIHTMLITGRPVNDVFEYLLWLDCAFH